jgi:signal transduction histidine kinase
VNQLAQWSEDALSWRNRPASLEGRLAVWSVAVLVLIVMTSWIEAVAWPRHAGLVAAIGASQAIAPFTLLALTMRAQNCRVLGWATFGAWIWLVVGWAYAATEIGWLGGLAGLLFLGEVGSGLLLVWKQFWQALLSAVAAAAFLAAIAARGAWHAQAIGELGLVLLGGVLGYAIVAALRSKSGVRRLFDQADQAFMERLIHEIRSPAGVIGMRAELLREQVEDAEVRAALEAIGAAAQRILNMADNLCDAFQIETGDIKSQPRPVDLNSVVESTAAELAPAARSRDVEIEMALDRSLPPLDVDPRHIKRVTANLLDNAVKFTPKGGRVTVSTMASSPWVKIAFKDTGPGLDPHKSELLFAPTRLSTRRPGAGGLGLFVARKMTELCGGKILVDSTPGHGATFTVIIPEGSKRSPTARPDGRGN